MATDKKSFLLYCDIIHTVNKLSDEQAGKLFKHILAYVNDLNPEPEDILTEIAFEPIKQSLKRDLVNYEKICERNRINGAKGGRPKNPKETEKTHSVLKKPKKADSDSDSDSDNDNDNKNIYRRFAHLSLSEADYIKLNKDYTKQQIDRILDSIENFANNKKYKSLYLTAKNWLKDEPKHEENNTMKFKAPWD